MVERFTFQYKALEMSVSDIKTSHVKKYQKILNNASKFQLPSKIDPSNADYKLILSNKTLNDIKKLPDDNPIKQKVGNKDFITSDDISTIEMALKVMGIIPKFLFYGKQSNK